LAHRNVGDFPEEKFATLSEGYSPMNKDTWPASALAAFGLLIASFVTPYLFTHGMSDGKDIAAIAGLFLSVTGTLVESLVGVHVGAAGKAKLQEERDRAVRATDKSHGHVVKR
jgi:hypothetical protein